ncbi:efflux RND transporter periplasmic adaptor subunit [Inhella sp.]|uniref:efflux RND transporter periplasmic adaptor subunit n=1 Tax=Inhella sp. TaxID=1921806 RepID=UPI0035B39278
MKPTLLRALPLALTLALMASLPAHAADAAAPYRTLTLQAGSQAGLRGFEGVVEAQRQTVLAAQVSGAIVEIAVKVGDRVKAGQLLIRLDARAAEQGAQASAAQAQAVKAQLALAQRDFERQQQLRAQGFISQGALDQAEAQFKASSAQLQAQAAALEAARTQTGFHRVTAPYDGVVAEVPVSLGDLAMPGRALVTVFDPRALRVTASVPQQLKLPDATVLQVEIPALGQRLNPTRVQRLPLADAGSQTQQVRLELPDSAAQPGQFARLLVPQEQAGAPTRLWVPQAAVVRRAELRAVYVLDPKGQPQLRQLRLGPVQGDQVEVLAGLSAGERVVLEPQRAAKGAQ